jgi:hypothetical protein
MSENTRSFILKGLLVSLIPLVGIYLIFGSKSFLPIFLLILGVGIAAVFVLSVHIATAEPPSPYDYFNDDYPENRQRTDEPISGMNRRNERQPMSWNKTNSIQQLLVITVAVLGFVLLFDSRNFLPVFVGAIVIWGSIAWLAWLMSPHRSTTRARGIHHPSETEVFPDLLPAAPLPHALKAMQTAHMPKKLLSSILLTDIGSIAYLHSDAAYHYRATPILSSARAIQPYAQVRLGHSGLWRFDFEICDFEGKVLFKREMSTYLEEGRHLIMPPARLRLANTLRVGVWTLNLRVNNELIARHRFLWQAHEQVDVLFETDGEVDENYLEKLEESTARPLSIDELLNARPTVKPRTLPR